MEVEKEGQQRGRTARLASTLRILHSLLGFGDCGHHLHHVSHTAEVGHHVFHPAHVVSWESRGALLKKLRSQLSDSFYE